MLGRGTVHRIASEQTFRDNLKFMSKIANSCAYFDDEINPYRLYDFMLCIVDSYQHDYKGLGVMTRSDLRRYLIAIVGDDNVRIRWKAVKKYIGMVEYLMEY